MGNGIRDSNKVWYLRKHGYTVVSAEEPGCARTETVGS